MMRSAALENGSFFVGYKGKALVENDALGSADWAGWWCQGLGYGLRLSHERKSLWLHRKGIELGGANAENLGSLWRHGETSWETREQKEGKPMQTWDRCRAAGLVPTPTAAVRQHWSLLPNLSLLLGPKLRQNEWIFLVPHFTVCWLFGLFLSSNFCINFWGW